MDDSLLTVTELAARLKCSRRQVDRLVKQGRIPYVPVGTDKRYRWSDVQAALPSVFAEPPGRASGLGQGAPDLITHLKRRAKTWPRMIQGGKP